MKRLYDIVGELEGMFPGRHFTPDGHMVGSIGEALVADAFALTLEKTSNKGFDAVAAGGQRVEIKATQGKCVAFRSCPESTIIIKIMKNGSFETIYNGPGKLIWDTMSMKPLPPNGQYQIRLNRLKELDKEVKDDQRIQPRA